MWLLERGRKPESFRIGRKSEEKAWKPDVRKLKPSHLLNKDMLVTLALGASLTIGAAYIFYRSWYGLVLGVAILPVCIRLRARSLAEKRERELKKHFISGMQMVSNALAAGYSIENSWRQAQRDLEKLYGNQNSFYLEMAEINRKVRMNEPIEVLFLEFAQQTQVEDIHNFAEIFQYAKRSGGNLSLIMGKTVDSMREKMEILTEIETTVAEKKLEQKLMIVMLPFILLYITITSPEYVELLYHNFFGIGIMSGCLAGYVISCIWSAKLVRIQV